MKRPEIEDKGYHEYFKEIEKYTDWLEESKSSIRMRMKAKDKHMSNMIAKMQDTLDDYGEELIEKSKQISELKVHADLKNVSEGCTLKVFITKSANDNVVYTIADQDSDIIRDIGSVEDLTWNIRQALK